MSITKRPERIKRPQRTSTVKARGATFQQLTHGLGTGQTALTSKTTGPFRGAHAAALAAKYAQYDAQAQAWIARALREPGVVAKISGNTGTSPELVVVGRYLSKGYVLHRTVFFQEEKLRFFRHFGRVFIADVAILAPGGGLLLLPIDGVYFHNRTLKQQLDAAQRNNSLTRLGRVVPVPDVECLSGVRLDAFLNRKGAP